MDSPSDSESPGLSLSLVSPPPNKTRSRIASPKPDGDKRKTSSLDTSPRKKLRLTIQQSHVLEQSFKDHPTLNHSGKQELAEKLKLRPRQVEVWFQNRRARTKMKKTEMEYEELKRQCEKLTEDNNRLKKELNELKNIQLITLFMD